MDPRPSGRFSATWVRITDTPVSLLVDRIRAFHVLNVLITGQKGELGSNEEKKKKKSVGSVVFSAVASHQDQKLSLHTIISIHHLIFAP